MSTVYVSGPISLNGTLSDEEIGANLMAFAAAADQLRDRGHTVLSPAELPKQESWEAYMRLCVPMVAKADLVYLLPGWSRSRGSMFEAEVAHVCGIPIEVAA